MDRMLLWGLLLLGIAMIIYIFRTPPLKDKLIIFLLKAYISNFLGIIAVKLHLLEYPVRFLGDFFDESLLYEYVMFPVVCVYFYHTSYRSTYAGIFLQCALYTIALTVVEVILERSTDLVVYHTWTWYYTLISVYIVMITVRLFLQWVRHVAEKGDPKEF
jgi:hypothetical protein